jgi:uncharacterized delta-60 repeat protein
MTSTLWMRTIHAVTALVAATAACAQWSFQLDTTFRTQIVQQNVNAIHVLPGTGIYLSGRVRFPGDMSDRPLSLIDETGEQVVSFPFSWGGGKMVPWTNRLYIQNGNLVRRMNLDGTIDLSFASQSGGSGSAPYISLPTNGDFHVFPDGRVLLSGSYTLSAAAYGFVGQYHLIWLTNTGYLDTTRVHRQANGVIRAFTELPDGKFLCSCTCTQYEGQPVSRLFRIHADGSLDTTFNAGVNWGNIYAYHPLPDGRVYVGGRYKRSAAPNDTIYLARFMPDGSLDGTFNNSNVLATNPGITGGTKVTQIVPWMEDKLFVMGVLQKVNGDPRGGICVLDTSGQLLPLLDECMTGAFSYQGSTNASVHGIIPTPDSTGFYIHGTYAGYTDGTTNDPGQRFVSRLLVSELTVGVEEQATQQGPGLRVYPNPAGSRATVYLEHLPPNAHLLLRDALGRMAQQQRVHNHTTTLDLRSLAGGVYTVEVSSGGRRVAVRRLVVVGQ